MKKLTLTLLIGLMLTGCISTVYHTPPRHSIDTYVGTSFVACNAVGTWWNDEYAKKYPVEATWMKLTWLVWVVDLPCEAVADTLWLPYDLYRRSEYQAYKATKKSSTNGRFGASSVMKPYELKTDFYYIDFMDGSK